MNARRDSSSEPSRGSFGGRVLLTAAALFAVGATAVLVLSDELKWLRLGIVAALWAALAGAFVAARYRRQVADQEDAAAERQERYELELEREIAARREYELEVAAEARRAAEENSRDDIAALRQELLGLRQTLESLLGGEFLVERYALRAESTRMRSLPDDRQLKRLPPALPREGAAVVPSVVEEAKTELIERVREVHQVPKRTVEPLARGGDRTPTPTSRPVPDQAGTHPAELSDRWFMPDGLGTNAANQPAGHGQRGEQPRRAKARDRYAEARQQGRAAAQPHGQAAVASGYLEPINRARPEGPAATSSGYLVTPQQSVAGNHPDTPTPSPGRATGPPTPGTPSHPDTSALRRAEPTPGQPAGHAGPAGGGTATAGYGTPPSRPDAATRGRPESSDFAAPTGRSDATGHGRAETSGYGSPVHRPDLAAHGSAESSGFGSPVGRTDGAAHGRSESSGYGAPVGRSNAAARAHAEASGYGSPVSRPDGATGWADGSGFESSVGRSDSAHGRAEESGFGPAVARPGAAAPGRSEASGYGPAVARPGAAGHGAESTGFGAAGHRAEASGYGSPVARPDLAAHGRAEASGFGAAVGRSDRAAHGRAEASGYGPAVSQSDVAHGRGEASGYGSPVARPDLAAHGRAEASGFGAAVGRPGAAGHGRAEASGFGSPVARPDGDSGYRPPVPRPHSSGYTPAPGQPEGAEPGGGGRRRRAEGQPSWQETAGQDNPRQDNARQDTTAGRRGHGRSDDHTASASGSHAAGRSVNELLASHGGTKAPKNPRRRRRRED